ncbi:MAG: hypothetical protein KJO69_10970, partial [Gammaproteobacteria bacterium]|nr:hypothetical protein [Gammaproteobacteria bacterium]
MKKLLILALLSVCVSVYAKDGTHPEFELLDKDGNLVTESGKAFSNARTCGDCHDASEKIEIFSEFILKGNLHPRVPLRDSEGKLVIETGEALSSTNTCGSCHDAKYIQSHSDHANAGQLASDAQTKSHPWSYGRGALAGWNFLDYDLVDGDEEGPDLEEWLTRYGQRHVGGGPVVEEVEMNCFMCHTSVVDLSARNSLLAEGEFEWANSAVFASKALLTYDEDEEAWTWNAEKFNTDGSVINNELQIIKPTDENCGLCHGLVDNSIEKPLVFSDELKDARVSRVTGQVFSPQNISQTGINISDKSDIERPFDVHAARVVGCTNCHYSLNNPVYYERFDEKRPEHLSFDPRRLSYSEYLRKPLHQFAKGNTLHGLASVTENSLRRCESCHAEESVHDWLPYKQRHFQALACESCHIPELYGPTLMSVDWGLPDPAGEPVKTYRNSSTDIGASNNMISAFQPILLPRENVGGKQKLAPFNLITGWFWLAGDPQAPVSREELLESFTDDGEYKVEVIAAFDVDQDGQLSDLERRLD